MTKPKTIEELNALPELPMFGKREATDEEKRRINRVGEKVYIPVLNETKLYPFDESDILQFVGEDGCRYRPVLGIDDKWYKQRLVSLSGIP